MGVYHSANDSSQRQLVPASTANVPARVMYLEPYDPPAAPAVSTSGLYEFWQLLLSRKWLILAFAALGVGLATLWSLRQTPIYLARISLEMQDGAGGNTVLGLREVNASDNSDAWVQTQVKILQSVSLRRRVLQKLRENGGKDPGPSSFASQSGAALATALPALTPRKDPGQAANAASMVTVLPPATSTIRTFGAARIMEIQVESPDPKFAAAFANTMAREYIDSNLEARWGAAQRTSDWLNKQLLDMRAKLEQSEAQLQNYSKNSGMVLANEQGQDNVAQDKLRQLQTELGRAEAERVAKQSIYEVATSAAVDTVPQVIDDGRLSGYQTKIAELKRELAEKSAALTAAHPTVIRLQAQLNEMEATLKRERDNVISRIRNDYDASVRREKMLAEAYRKQMAVVTDNSTKSIYYGILKREVETNRRLYEELLQKMKEVGIGSALPGSTVRILDPADVPMAPYKPNHISNMAIGLALGLILGCLVVFTSDQVNHSLKAPGEASYYLKLPELGVIPSNQAAARSAKIDEKNLMPLKEGANGAWSAGSDSVELVTWRDRPSVVAESYRSTLASILAAKGLKDRPRVILITSVDRGEGKSTTVSNLGIALAEINQRVLLLDADLRKPHLHKIFNLPNAWGLSNLLRERISLKDSPIEALVKPTDIENLYVLPSGPGTLSIANLLYSNRMAELIERLKDEFDTVIIDTPPMLYLSDARVLGRLAEGAILVLRAGKTTRDAALHAKQRLVDDGINVLGTVLNDWNPKDRNRYGYYRYNYSSDNT